ncbi:HesB/IscA family protein [Pseudomonadota bacterium]
MNQVSSDQLEVNAPSKNLIEDEIKITPPAFSKLTELLRDADEEFDAIRVFVSGGGCGGMTYGMTYSEKENTMDSVLTVDDFKLLVDPVALSYLDGAEIDYVDDGVNATFVFNNVFQAVGGSGACAGCGGAQ